MIITLEVILRLSAVGIFFLWWLYWRIAEHQAYQSKPKQPMSESVISRASLLKLALALSQVVLIFQLFSWEIFPFSFSPAGTFFSQIIGFLLIVIGVLVAISGRKTLGDNWAHAAEYQVKKKQELVDTGVYSVIRHPIYSGLVLGYIGGELLAQSYLVFAGILFYIGGYYQARLEEKLLIKHFGEKYKTYMKRTKMFLPFLW